MKTRRVECPECGTPQDVVRGRVVVHKKLKSFCKGSNGAPPPTNNRLLVIRNGTVRVPDETRAMARELWRLRHAR